MVFKVPETSQGKPESRFEFEFDGRTLSVPLLGFASPAAAAEFEAGRETSGLLMTCDTPEARRAIESMAGDQFGALLNAWTEASGVTPGESAGSSGSSATETSDGQ